MSALLLLLAALGGATDPKNGDELVRAMHDRYDSKWYHSLTFLQHNTRYFGTDSVQHSTWFERAAIPGKLRIDFRDGPGFAPTDGILFVNDSLIAIKGDSVARSDAFIHPLMVLGFDVYAQPVERTTAQLRQLGYDLSKVRADVWQDRLVWVVGADSGDLRHKQFWIDQERLVFVRSLEPARRDSTIVVEVQFNKYQRIGQGWIAPEVVQLRNGALVIKEEYADMRVDVALPPALWDATAFPEATWMR